MWVVADEKLQSLGVTGEKKKYKRGEEVPLFRTIDWLVALVIPSSASSIFSLDSNSVRYEGAQCYGIIK
jgi:hypothetical protein